MKLDKNQSYGQVSGYHYGAVFEQHGRLFDAEGDEIVIKTTKAEEPEFSMVASGLTSIEAAVMVADIRADQARDAQAAKEKPAKKTPGRKPKQPADMATKGAKKKVVFPVNPPIPALAVAAKASAVDDQLAAQSQ